MKKQIVVVMNGKGGVGKSFFANNFVQYLKDRGISHTAVDTDNENSTLKRFHPEAQFINIANTQEIDLIFAALEKSALVVVDCRAASTDIFLDYFTEIRAFELLTMLGASLTVVSPVNHEADSVEQVRTITENLGARCQYVVVRNESHSTQFRLYELSQTRSRVLNDLAGYEIVMPRLYDWLVTALNESNLPLGQAITHPDFSLVDRQRLKNWQVQFEHQIDAAQAALLPSEEPAATETKAVRKAKAH